MTGFFDQSEIAIPCAKCGHQTQKSIAWLKANAQFVCAGCGQVIRLESEELLRGIKKAEKSIADFVRDVSDTGTQKA